MIMNEMNAGQVWADEVVKAIKQKLSTSGTAYIDIASMFNHNAVNLEYPIREKIAQKIVDAFNDTGKYEAKITQGGMRNESEFISVKLKIDTDTIKINI